MTTSLDAKLAEVPELESGDQTRVASQPLPYHPNRAISKRPATTGSRSTRGDGFDRGEAFASLWRLVIHKERVKDFEERRLPGLFGPGDPAERPNSRGNGGSPAIDDKTERLTPY